MGAINFSLDEKLLEVFTRALQLEVFVETGTFEGASLRLAFSRFKESYSVELSPELFEAAQRNFANRPNVHLFRGKSPDVLRTERARFCARPTLFWLDAHWCVAEHSASEDSQSPLLDELAAIGSLHEQSVILIDDARLYLAPPPAPHRATDWPGFDSVVKALFGLSRIHRLMVLNDVILFYPERVDAIVQQHAQAHGADWLSIASEAGKHRRRKQRWSWFRWGPKSFWNSQ